MAFFNCNQEKTNFSSLPETISFTAGEWSQLDGNNDRRAAGRGEVSLSIPTAPFVAMGYTTATISYATSANTNTLYIKNPAEGTVVQLSSSASISASGKGPSHRDAEWKRAIITIGGLKK